jgi:hypothetical protein
MHQVYSRGKVSGMNGKAVFSREKFPASDVLQQLPCGVPELNDNLFVFHGSIKSMKISGHILSGGVYFVNVMDNRALRVG